MERSRAEEPTAWPERAPSSGSARMASSGPAPPRLPEVPRAGSTEADGELTTVWLSIEQLRMPGTGSAAKGIRWSAPSATTTRVRAPSASATGPSTIRDSARARSPPSSTASASLQRRCSAVTARSMRRRPGSTAERRPDRETTHTKLCALAHQVLDQRRGVVEQLGSDLLHRQRPGGGQRGVAGTARAHPRLKPLALGAQSLQLALDGVGLARAVLPAEHLHQGLPGAPGPLLEGTLLGAEARVHVALDVHPRRGEHLEQGTGPGALARLERRGVPAGPGLLPVKCHQHAGQQLVAAVHRRRVGRACARTHDGPAQLLGELERLEHVPACVEKPSGDQLGAGQRGEADRLVHPVADGMELRAARRQGLEGLRGPPALHQRTGEVDPGVDRRPPVPARLQPLQRLLEELPGLVGLPLVEAQEPQVVQGEGHESHVARPGQQRQRSLECAPGLVLRPRCSSAMPSA